MPSFGMTKVAFIVTIHLGLSGCAATQSQEPVARASSSVQPSAAESAPATAEWDDQALSSAVAAAAPERPRTEAEAQDAAWQELGLPESMRPEVETVRAVGPEEINDIYHSCMEEQGFPSSVDVHGQRGIEFDPSQEDALKVAGYVCSTQYPLEHKYLEPYNLEQLRLLYDWRVEETISCLRELGVETAAPPSYEVFVDDYARTGYQVWSPLSEEAVFEQLEALVAAEQDNELFDACPDTPPDEVLYPD
ncbi:hypothetical protein [Serinicoccus profundi]|uniref:hypothetical protein n=1 Tax=Serinicoccus profundi TaxID=1078471 RepID=UPI000255E904|nr:hypothetical protein [Serinicoccus profundi]